MWRANKGRENLSKVARGVAIGAAVLIGAALAGSSPEERTASDVRDIKNRLDRL